MTDKEILIAFRSEVERLKDSCASPIVICDTLLSFIDSMQEEPKAKFKVGDVVIYAASHIAYAGLYLLGNPNDLSIGYSNANEPYNIALRNCAVASEEEHKQFMRELESNGYKWNESSLRIEKKEESASEDLEKEIQRYTEQKKLSDVRFLIPGIARHFANWQKQYMMKDAFSFTIMKAQYCDEHLPPLKDLATLPLIRFSPRKLLERGLKVGDKVKVVIIKED